MAGILYERGNVVLSVVRRTVPRRVVLIRIYFIFCRLMEHVEMGSGYNVSAAIAKVEVRRIPFAFTPWVNGSILEL